MYVRYRQVAEYLSTAKSVHPTRINKASLVIGLIDAFGLTLVANFQVCVETWIINRRQFYLNVC